MDDVEFPDEADGGEVAIHFELSEPSDDVIGVAGAEPMESDPDLLVFEVAAGEPAAADGGFAEALAVERLEPPESIPGHSLGSEEPVVAASMGSPPIAASIPDLPPAPSGGPEAVPSNDPAVSPTELPQGMLPEPALPDAGGGERAGPLPDGGIGLPGELPPLPGGDPSGGLPGQVPGGDPVDDLLGGGLPDLPGGGWTGGGLPGGDAGGDLIGGGLGGPGGLSGGGRGGISSVPGPRDAGGLPGSGGPTDDAGGGIPGAADPFGGGMGAGTGQPGDSTESGWGSDVERETFTVGGGFGGDDSGTGGAVSGSQGAGPSEVPGGSPGQTPDGGLGDDAAGMVGDALGAAAAAVAGIEAQSQAIETQAQVASGLSQVAAGQRAEAESWKAIGDGLAESIGAKHSVGVEVSPGEYQAMTDAYGKAMEADAAASQLEEAAADALAPDDDDSGSDETSGSEGGSGEESGGDTGSGEDQSGGAGSGDGSDGDETGNDASGEDSGSDSDSGNGDDGEEEGTGDDGDDGESETTPAEEGESRWAAPQSPSQEDLEMATGGGVTDPPAPDVGAAGIGSSDPWAPSGQVAMASDDTPEKTWALDPDARMRPGADLITDPAGPMDEEQLGNGG